MGGKGAHGGCKLKGAKLNDLSGPSRAESIKSPLDQLS